MKSGVRRLTAAGIAGALVVIASMTPGRAMAQVVAGGNTTINSSGAGYLGILQLKCDCTMRVDAQERFRSFRFRTDPVIVRIESGSPADGHLKAGDYITHIDGERLRSIAGAEKFADIEPGQTVALTIWRDGITSVVRIKAKGIDWDDNRVLGTLAPVGPGPGVRLDTWDNGAVGVIAAAPAPRSPRSPRPGAAVRAVAPEMRVVVPGESETPQAPGAPPATPAPGAPDAPPAPMASTAPAVWAVVTESVAPSGWFGFSFRCSDCGWARSGRRADPIWESTEAPELSMISRGSPAEKAGLQRGDRLTHIDGYSVTGPEGSRRLGAVKPGQRVQLRVLRDGKPLTRTLTLGTRPEARAVAAVAAARPTTQPPRATRELRYTGKIDDVSVEVWSTAGSSVTRVGDTMVITVGNTVVRLKAEPKR